MYWMIPLALSVACAFINPNVGIFGGIFMSVQLIIMFCFGIGGSNYTKISLHDSGSENKPYTDKLKKVSKNVLVVWCAWAVILFIICSGASIVWFFLQVGDTVSDPNITLSESLGDTSLISILTVIFTQGDAGSLFLLVAGVALNLLAVILIFLRTGKLIKRGKTPTGSATEVGQVGQIEQSMPVEQNPQYNQSRQPYAQNPQYNQYGQPYAQNPQPNPPIAEVPERIFRVGVLPFVFLALSVIFGMLDYKLGWLALPLNACYLLFIGILKINLFVYRKAAAIKAPMQPAYSNQPVLPLGASAIKHNAHFALSKMGKGGSLNKTMVLLVWILPLITIGLQAMFIFIQEEPVFAIFSFRVDYVFWILASICNILTAVFLTKAVRRI